MQCFWDGSALTKNLWKRLARYVQFSTTTPLKVFVVLYCKILKTINLIKTKKIIKFTCKIQILVYIIICTMHIIDKLLSNQIHKKYAMDLFIFTAHIMKIFFFLKNVQLLTYQCLRSYSTFINSYNISNWLKYYWPKFSIWNLFRTSNILNNQNIHD